nr:hypothetical protein [Pedobacter sp. ASV19]
MLEKFYRCLFFLLLFGFSSGAQDLLHKPISIDIRQEPLSKALDKIAAAGDFSFSYNGRILPQDSLISISAKQMPLALLLRKVIGPEMEYLQNGRFIIVRKVLKPLTLVTSDIVSSGNQLSVSGIVIDQTSGERLKYASVYEKTQLVSALTDEHGYFRLKLHRNDRYGTGITLSKQGYKDTTFYFLETISVFKGNKERAGRGDAKTGAVERTGLGQMLISARKKWQGLNITDFFANRPFQFSAAPEVSSRGMMGPQVINNFSLNLTGGYTGGVDGMEVAGVFNINKKDMRYLQLAGVFNLTGGSASGLQVSGVQNRTLGEVNGLQLSGFMNSTDGTLKGVQISMLNNYAHHLKGLQIGLVNVADSSSGLSIGLINIIRSGFYSVALSATGEMNTVLTLKTGTRNLYTAVIFGNNISDRKKQYAFGMGLGSQLKLTGPLSADVEADYLFANEGSWDDRWIRLHGSLNFALSKNIALFAGPVYNWYHSDKTYSQENYRNLAGLPAFGQPYSHTGNTRHWLGWQGGISYTGAFAATVPVVQLHDANWELELGLGAGRTINDPQSLLELTAAVKKSFDGSFYGLFGVGYMHLLADKKSDAYPGVRWINSALDFIPVKAGIRKMIGTKFYIGSDLGFAFLLDAKDYPASTSFLYAPNIGYLISSHAALQFRYEDFTSFSMSKQLMLKLAYKIPLSK